MDMRGDAEMPDHPVDGRHGHASGERPRTRSAASSHGFLYRWFLANTFFAGFFALAWLVLRSGAKPSRLAYPCQQAALSAASLAFGAPIVSALIAARRRLAAGLRSPAGVVVALAVVAVGLGVSGYLVGVDAYQGPVLEARGDYRAQLYHVSNSPEDPDGDRFPGMDALILLMGSRGTKFFESAVVTQTSGPDGLIASDDVVVIKINYQWPERGGTNTDLLRGLIRLIVDHPDSFSGEIVVCENTQFAGADNFDRADNNAQDHGLSPRDVVNHFRALGHDVSPYDWTLIRYTSVAEYSGGDMNDGYVIGAYDPLLHGRTSYPKFETQDGSFISLRYGVWDDSGSSYDLDRLKLINIPVLKSHHATYGATACVKNYMGLVTGELGTNSHSAIRYGMMGAVMGEIRPPDLNILDSIWINAHPDGGPWTSYGEATRRNEIVATTDPVAADIWATTNILIPAFLDNGHTPPWPNPDATPDDPTSDFRVYLDNSMNWLLAAGYDATNDLASIDLHSIDMSLAVFSDGFESGDTTQWSLSALK
jgi:hypothetical protein